MEILKNKKEQEIADRNSAILEMYTALLQQYPDVKPWRILRTIGAEYNLTPEWVKDILVRKGAFVQSPKN